MEQKDLTNEKLLKKFKSQFALVAHAIGVAEHLVLSGKEGRGKTENQNIALEVMDDLNDQADSHTLREFFRTNSAIIIEDVEFN